MPSISSSHLLSCFPTSPVCHVFLQTSPGSLPQNTIPKAQGALTPWMERCWAPHHLQEPPTHCPGRARAAHRRSSQGHRHGYYNYILDGIPKFPFIYIPTLPSSFPLFVPRISTEFTGKSTKVIRSASGLAFMNACPDEGRRETGGSSCVWP